MYKVSGISMVYEGSVKNLRAKKKPSAKKPGVFIFEFTDDYSIFDYGKMPDAIPGKGAAMAIGSAFFFETIESSKAWKVFADSKAWNKIKNKKTREALRGGKTFAKLKKSGMPTHYRGLIDPETGKTVRLNELKRLSHLLEVDAVRIIHPEPMHFGGRRIWNYNNFDPSMSNFLVPLECVFRFGVPNGSSLFERMKLPGYLEALGLSEEPKPNDWLPRPVVEYFSKLEPADRHLNYELALNACGLDNDTYEELYEGTLLLALFLHDVFAKANLILWDGKFEYLKTDAGLTLGDAITPDELRLTYKGVQISKEPLRQYYKKYHPEFVEAMKTAKILAAKSKDRKSLRDIVCDDLKCPPPVLDEQFKATVADMYAGVTAHVSGTKLFGDVRPLTAVLKSFKKFGIV